MEYIVPISTYKQWKKQGGIKPLVNVKIHEDIEMDELIGEIAGIILWHIGALELR